jgi:hypothetical protein
MSNPDVWVGARVLEYSERIEAVMVSLSEASDHAHRAADLLGGGVYEGRAAAEMKVFFESYAVNIDKLASFQSAAQLFLGKVIEEFEFTDAELAAAIQIWLEGPG